MNPPRLLLLMTILLGLLGGARADALADARRLADAGQAESALDVVDKALLSRPGDVELRFMRGVLLADLGRADVAMTAFEALNQEHPELPDPLNNLAVLHAARGELEQARSLLEAAVRNNPGHLGARENLGDVYLHMAIREWQAVARDFRPEAALARKLALARQLATQAASKP